MGRQALAVKGLVIGFVSQVVALAAKLLVRTFVIRFLGAEVLGLDSVLIDVVNMLSLAEMGITTAMLYRLYVPVIERDEHRIKQLMTAYRQIFIMISSAIMVIGVLLSFFLQWIIKDVSIPWPQIYLAFYLQLACTISTYLMSHYRILMNADQKKHIITLADLAAILVFSGVKIVSIVLFKSYAAYLLISIIQAIASNSILAIYTRRRYEFIKEKVGADKKDFRSLFGDMKEVLGGKLAGYVYGSTDNLIISIFMGTVTVGLLSNYKYISVAMRGLIYSATSAMQPLLGNYLNSDTPKDKSFQTLRRYSFFRYLLAGATAVPFVCLADILVQTWTGDARYLMPFIITILLALDYYIGCVYGPLGEYLIGMGMFRYEKYVAAAGALSNLVLSLIGVRIFGIAGVLLATVVSQMILWIGKGYVLFVNYYGGYKDYHIGYIKDNIYYFVVVVFVCAVTLLISELLSGFGILIRFVAVAVVSEICFVLAVVLLFRKTDEFTFVVQTTKKLIMRPKKHATR